MKKILVFGNSSSGKTTLARELSTSLGLDHLDLDTLAWQLTSPPERRPLRESEDGIRNFIKHSEGWIIEGCYTDLLELISEESEEIIFLNIPIEECITNAKSRPWEPHKYESKEAQDANLGMLIDWIQQYATRDDTFSEASHKEFYEKYSGKKRMITSHRQHA